MRNILLSILLLCGAQGAFAQESLAKVTMLVPDDYTKSADEKAAVDWFTKTYVNNGTGVLLTPSTVSNLSVNSNSMCWVMCDRIGIEHGYEHLSGGLSSPETINALKAFCADGGNLLLTNHATQLTVALGRIADTYAPGIFGSGEGEQNKDVWGVQPIIGNKEGQIYDHSNHDIYSGLTPVSGLYARSIYAFEGAGFKSNHNCMWDLTKCGLTESPNVVKAWEDMTNSTVLGTWNHVVDYCCAGIVDFNPTTTFNGRILAVGLASYEWNLGGENSYKGQLEIFTQNCINYVNKAAVLNFKAYNSDGYYTTFSTDKDVVFTDDVVVYAVSVSGTVMEQTALTKKTYTVTANKAGEEQNGVVNGYYVPADNGVLIWSRKDNTQYYFPVKEEKAEALPANNMLKPAKDNGIFTPEKGCKYYKLAYGNYETKTNLGFYYGAADGGAFNVKKGLAYLEVPAAAEAPSRFVFDNESTGISGIGTADKKTDTIYNIAGQRVNTVTKPGIYIVNGNKFIIK